MPGSGLPIDTSVDLQLYGAARAIDQRTHVTHLRALRIDEALPPESRIDGHHENQIDVAQDMLDQRNGRTRIQGHTRYFAETSSTERYAPTRSFYVRAGFREVASIADFYRAGDGKVIYEKRL